MAWKLRIQTVTGPMVIPIEVDLIFKMGYKLRGKKRTRRKIGGGENQCALRAGKGEGASNGDRVISYRTKGLLGCHVGQRPSGVGLVAWWPASVQGMA